MRVSKKKKEKEEKARFGGECLLSQHLEAEVNISEFEANLVYSVSQGYTEKSCLEKRKEKDERGRGFAQLHHIK